MIVVMKDTSVLTTEDICGMKAPEMYVPVMVYTIDRETPDKSLGKYTVEEMTAFVQPLIDEGFDIQVRG